MFFNYYINKIFGEIIIELKYPKILRILFEENFVIVGKI